MNNAGTFGDDDGVVMVDALIAVIIVSLMIAVCISSLKIIRGFSSTAQEARAAAVTLSALIESVPRVPGNYNGVTGDFVYRARIAEESSEGFRLCQIDLTVRPGAGGRLYRLRGTRLCSRLQGGAE